MAFCSLYMGWLGRCRTATTSRKRWEEGSEVYLHLTVILVSVYLVMIGHDMAKKKRTAMERPGSVTREARGLV